MALVYTQTLAENKWLFSDNNNIVEFTDDDTTRSIRYAEISIGSDLPLRIYPDNNGVVWVNLKEYIAPRLRDYDDDIDVNNIQANNINTFIQNWNKAYLNEVITIVVTYTSGSTVSDTIQPKILLGAEQPYNVFRGVTARDKDVHVLSPFSRLTSTRHYMRYWEGYPFDIAFTKKLSDGTNITTITNRNTGLSTPAFATANNVNRLFISTGITTVTLEDYLPIPIGYNELMIDSNTFIDLIKEDARCGTYIKWLNSYGGFNYWLFKDSEEEQQSRSIGTINNDFANVLDTVSQSKSLGRTANDILTVEYSNLTRDDIDLLKGVLLSPKIYLYMGTRFSPSDTQDWIEINIDSKNIALNNFKNRVPNGTIDFNLQDKYTITL